MQSTAPGNTNVAISVKICKTGYSKGGDELMQEFIKRVIEFFKGKKHAYAPVRA